MNLDETIKTIQQENNLKLPEEDRLPTSGDWRDFCLDKYDGYNCTKQKHHKGKHGAHNQFAVIIQEW